MTALNRLVKQLFASDDDTAARPRPTTRLGLNALEGREMPAILTAGNLFAHPTANFNVPAQSAAVQQYAATPQFDVYGAIRDKWVSLGGAGGVLGAATSSETDAPRGGRVTHFRYGDVYWSPATGAHEVHGAIRDRYNALGGASGFLGLPTTDETKTPDGVGRYNHFQGGSVYWTPATGAQVVSGAIRDKWASLGWENSPLGYPTSGEYAGPNGSRISNFQKGMVIWSPATGAHEVHGTILGEYLAKGGPGGILGLPTSDELAGPKGSRISNFQRGIVVWSAGTGAHEVHGAILGEYLAKGGAAGFLGLPTTDELTAPDGVGKFNHFQGGSVYWSPATGAREIHGVIRDKWAAMGWERGPLGYPTSDEMKWGTGAISYFQHGSITWTAAGGPVVNLALAGNYLLTASRSQVRVRSLTEGLEHVVDVPVGKISSQQQDDAVKSIVDNLADYFKVNAGDILKGKIKAADIGGIVYGTAAAGVLKLFAPLAAYEALAQGVKKLVPGHPDLSFTNAATQTGRYYGAIVDDFVSILKGESKPTIANVVGTMASLTLTRIVPAGALVAPFGIDGWTFTKNVGKEIGGALSTAVDWVGNAAGSLWNTITHPGDLLKKIF